MLPHQSNGEFEMHKKFPHAFLIFVEFLIFVLQIIVGSVICGHHILHIKTNCTPEIGKILIVSKKEIIM